MFPALAKYIGGKVLTAILVVACSVVIIWYYRLPLEDRAAIWNVVRGALVWIGLVVLLPWATFFLTLRVVRADANWAGAVLLAGYLLADIAFALYLTRGAWGSPWQGAIMILGFLCAAVYNFVACEFIADKAEDSL